MIFYSKQLGVYMAAAAGVWTRCLAGFESQSYAGATA
jgi:hypothetical protein